MGNPHPTKSKPLKIGRKHTQSERLHQRVRREKGLEITKKTIFAKRRKVENNIRKYWEGEIDTYPN